MFGSNLFRKFLCVVVINEKVYPTDDFSLEHYPTWRER